MADQNLLNDDDFFAKAMPDKEEPKDKKEKVYSEEDDMFKPKNLDEQSAEELAYIESSLQERSDFDSQPKIESQDFSETIQEDLQNSSLEKPAPPDASQPIANQNATPQSNDISYKQVYFDMDDQQESVSYKPFFITLLVIIILGVGGYFSYTLYLKDKFFSTFQTMIEMQKTQEEQPVVAGEQEPVVDTPPQQSLLEKQKSSYLSKVSSQTNHDIVTITNVIAISRKSAKLSSVLLYGSDLIIEVFGKSQENLARLNNELKRSNKIRNLKVISSSQRLGVNGGVFGIYSAQLTSADAGNREVSVNLSDNIEANSWLRNIFASNKLKVKNYKNRSIKTQDLFKVHEIEAIANGSINSCLNALNAIAAAGSNVKLYKLTCSAVDQQNFGEANYQLKLVLKIYV